MRSTKHVFKLLAALSVTAALFSCNSNSKPPNEEVKVTADTTIAPPPAAAVVPEEFDIAEVAHSVKDYDKWRPVFNSDSVNRKASDLQDLAVGRGIDKPNNVLIVLKVSDMQKGKAFAADPRLKEAMKKGGVVSKPDVEFFHVVRFNLDSKEKQWVTVTHKVKDFDAWVKAYDGEGKDKRASEGMVDVALARGSDDPNIVQVVFDITDLAKAKAAISSSEKKKLMTSAGVEGTPKIEFYKTAE